MSEPTLCGVCGKELEGPWVRFHHLGATDKNGVAQGHYIDGKTRDLGTPLDVEGAQGVEGMAPAPPGRQKVHKALTKLLVPLEEELRWDGISFLRLKGNRVYNLEQGHRPGGGHTRVGLGIPDTYFQGHGITGWIEFKRAEGKTAREKMSGDQKLFEKSELENGGVYLLIESTRQLEEWDRIHRGKQQEIEL